MTIAARPFLVVGIGASAGGLEAFKSFLGDIQPGSGMAFVLVQHLSPDHKSMLAELLDRATALDVVEAVDGVTLKPDCVFVIPPDATMTVAGGRLKIVRPAPPRDRRRPIDTFMQSLAEDQGERAVCIILSGTGSDGTLGVAAIKERGGFTLAEAEYDHHAKAGMPRSAADTGQVDEVLQAEAMPARLTSYREHLARVASGKDEEGVRQDAASHLATILKTLHVRTGHDFSEYKEKTIIRRLQRRMQVLQVETPEAYIARLSETPEELDMLLREFLISVTQFFRDPAAFEALNTAVLEPLAASKTGEEDIRIWVPGCATGEEAYSLAILLREALDVRRPRPRIQVFATDLDERAIAVARAGRYAKAAAGLSPERAERWFNVEGDEWCINAEIREMCIFSVHSAVKHPPFSRLDLISCRNLLIYLDAAVQDRLMQTFHYGLRPGGRLFLGSSESMSRMGKLFSVVDKKHRIFERQDVAVTSLPAFAPSRRGAEAGSGDAQAGTGDGIDRSIRKIIDKYSPPHLLLDRSNRIVRFSGGTVGQYLEPSPGAASLGLFDILRKALRPAAREVMHEVRTSHETIRRDNVAIRIDGKPRLVSLTAERLAEQGPEGDYVVLAIHDVGPGTPRSKADPSSHSTDELQTVQQELRTTRTQLQSTIDELETANEEMKSSNEEYQSVNEELQSSNEELETAKEEMQSINEELQTINTEIGSKNEQLIQLNSDLSNLLESTEIATLFLDDSLRVRRFTRGVSDVFHLRDADVGRPITEIVTLLDYPDLDRDVKLVLRKLTAIERQVNLHDSSASFILQIRPYRTVDNVIDGVVMTFVDITARQAADAAVRTSEAKFRMLFDYIDEGFCTLDKVQTATGEPSDYVYLSANPGFEQQSGLKNPVGRTVREVNPDESDIWFEIYDRVWQTGEAIRFESELQAQGRVLEAYVFRFDNGAGQKLGVIFLDISDRKRHEEQQELLLREMDHRVKNLFAVTSGIVSLSARSSSSSVDMAATIQGRLGALASSHQLVRPRRQQTIDRQAQTTLAQIIKTVLKPYVDTGAGSSRCVIDGPDVAVGSDATTSMAMILHELATNAAKYGSLSGTAGQVQVSWTHDEHTLDLSWVESGGPMVPGPPHKEGFGSLLARRSVTGQLSGHLDHDWRPEGLQVKLLAAIERLTA